MSNFNKISVIIPCYNEEKSIIQVINLVYLNLIEIKKKFEIIVVDDFSNDSSFEKLKILEKEKKIILLRHRSNQGKGSALISGFNIASGEIIIIQDADFEYSPKDYGKILLPFIEANADVVYGSRFLGGDRYVRIHFFWHFIANKILTFLCNIVTNLNLTDMETGCKAFKREKIKLISLKEKSFGIEPEITIKLAKKKCKFFEVSISYNGRGYDEGKKIGIKDAFDAIYCIIKYSIFN